MWLEYIIININIMNCAFKQRVCEKQNTNSTLQHKYATSNANMAYLERTLLAILHCYKWSVRVDWLYLYNHTDIPSEQMQVSDLTFDQFMCNSICVWSIGQEGTQQWSSGQTL